MQKEKSHFAEVLSIINTVLFVCLLGVMLVIGYKINSRQNVQGQYIHVLEAKLTWLGTIQESNGSEIAAINQYIEANEMQKQEMLDAIQQMQNSAGTDPAVGIIGEIIKGIFF